jgi:hypothetical protein
MNEVVGSAQKRPTAITIICVLMAFGSLVAVPLAFSKAAHQVGPWYPPLLLISSILGLVSLVGFWLMRRWAVFLYTGVFVVVQIVMLSLGQASPIGTIIPLIVIASGFIFLKQMR